MPTVLRPTVKHATAVRGGEFIRLMFRNQQIFGIVANVESGRAGLSFVALGMQADGGKPVAVNSFSIDDVVVSYGTDWVFEVAPSDVHSPGTSGPVQASGTVTIDADGAKLAVDVIGESFGRLAQLDLTTFAFGQPSRPYEFAQAERWRIWASAEDRARPGGVPLFEFTAQAPAS